MPVADAAPSNWFEPPYPLTVNVPAPAGPARNLKVVAVVAEEGTTHQTTTNNDVVPVRHAMEPAPIADVVESRNSAAATVLTFEVDAWIVANARIALVALCGVIDKLTNCAPCELVGVELVASMVVVVVDTPVTVVETI
jgi:hypothetical protein